MFHNSVIFPYFLCIYDESWKTRLYFNVSTHLFDMFFVIILFLVDSISISFVAESLKHIGHSQTLSNPILGQQTTDPFDRMISVPQIIDYLLQLFNHTRTLYGLNNHDQKSTTDSSYGHNSGVDADNLKVNEPCLNNIHGSNSNLKDHINEPYSTLPGSRPSDVSCTFKIT